MENVSKVFGIHKEKIRGHVSDDGLRKLAIQYLEDIDTYVPGLKKLKARAMLEAIKIGHYEKGNHRIEYKERVFYFYYRGTLIMEWHVDNEAVVCPHAGDFENTASTTNQRKEIEKAIENFRKAVMEL